MTPERKQIVQQAWASVEQRGDDLARAFYARLFEIDSSAHALFTSTDMPAQRQKLMAMLRDLVDALDDAPRLVHETAALARRHVSYGVIDHQYDSVGAALLHAFEETLGEEAFTDEVKAAWTEAYALLASIMRRAAALPGGK